MSTQSSQKVAAGPLAAIAEPTIRYVAPPSREIFKRWIAPTAIGALGGAGLGAASGAGTYALAKKLDPKNHPASVSTAATRGALQGAIIGGGIGIGRAAGRSLAEAYSRGEAARYAHAVSAQLGRFSPGSHQAILERASANLGKNIAEAHRELPRVGMFTGGVMGAAASKPFRLQTKKEPKMASDYHIDKSRVKPKNFVFPKSKGYPIGDATHARNALARVAQNGSPAQQAKVEAAVHKKFPGIGKEASAHRMYVLGQLTHLKAAAKDDDEESPGVVQGALNWVKEHPMISAAAGGLAGYYGGKALGDWSASNAMKDKLQAAGSPEAAQAAADAERTKVVDARNDNLLSGSEWLANPGTNLKQVANIATLGAYQPEGAPAHMNNPFANYSAAQRVGDVSKFSDPNYIPEGLGKQPAGNMWGIGGALAGAATPGVVASMFGKKRRNQDEE